MTISSALLYALASGTLQTAPLQTVPPRTAPATEARDEQDAQPTGAPVSSADGDVVDDVLVSGPRPRGSVSGDIEPDITLTSEQLAAYGATNVAELLAAVEPLTRSGRGRGDGGPVVLLNGRRTSGFQEIRGIPFEAIERFEILPEEVALTYGFAADQRVVNIILKSDFRQGSLQGRASGPAQGGRTTTGAQISAFQVNVRDRWNFELEQTQNTALWEDERDITRSPGSQPFDLIGNVAGIPYGSQIDPALTTLAGTPVTVAANPGVSNPTLAQFAAGANAPRTGDLGAYRTLLPRGDATRLTTSWARDLNETVKGTVSLTLNDTASFSYLGLPGVTLQAPAGRNGSPFSRDVNVYRYIADPGAVTRDNETLTGNLGLLLDGYVGDYRWTLSGAYDRVETDTVTGRGLDATAARAAVTAGTLNPFGALAASSFTRRVDTANAVASGGSLEAVLTGDLFDAPAGGVNATIKLGGDTRTLDAESSRYNDATGTSVFSSRSIGRDRAYGTVNFTLPVSDPSREILGFLGDLSVNVNAGYDHASDFGGLTTLGAGFNWVPADPFSVIVSYTDEEGAPTIQQLNDPVITTPNSPVFDYRTNKSVLINRIDGGNAGLSADNRHVWKVGLNFKPWSATDFSVSTNYTNTVIENAISAFPTITADLEAALPSRFTRVAGELVSIDARPLNYAETRREELRTGFNYSRAFGTPTPPAAGAPGAPGAPGAGGMPGLGGGRPGGAGGPPPGAGGGQGRAGFGAVMFGGGGRGGFGGGQPGQGRFIFSVYHTYRFADQITIADTLPVLDLLDGAATGARGGSPRNEIQVQGGVFKSGLGAFMNANWLEGTEVDGGVGGSDLTFGSQATVNLNMFADLASRPTWVAKFPWLKGSRINLGIQNLFDSRQDVRSSTGDIALNYQPDYLDPQGRVISLTFRKILY